MSPRPQAALVTPLRAVPSLAVEPAPLPAGERRRDPRREVALFAHLITAGGRRDQIVLVRDLSSSGARLRLLRPTHLSLEDAIGATLVLPTGDRPEPLRVGLRVVRVGEATEAHLDLGCAFEPATDSTRERLARI